MPAEQQLQYLYELQNKMSQDVYLRALLGEAKKLTEDAEKPALLDIFKRIRVIFDAQPDLEKVPDLLAGLGEVTALYDQKFPGQRTQRTEKNATPPPKPEPEPQKPAGEAPPPQPEPEPTAAPESAPAPIDPNHREQVNTGYKPETDQERVARTTAEGLLTTFGPLFGFDESNPTMVQLTADIASRDAQKVNWALEFLKQEVTTGQAKIIKLFPLSENGADYYQQLGLSRTDFDGEDKGKSKLKKQYRRLIKIFHTDNIKADDPKFKQFEKITQEIHTAYGVLNKDSSRSSYNYINQYAGTQRAPVYQQQLSQSYETFLASKAGAAPEPEPQKPPTGGPNPEPNSGPEPKTRRNPFDFRNRQTGNPPPPKQEPGAKSGGPESQKPPTGGPNPEPNSGPEPKTGKRPGGNPFAWRNKEDGRTPPNPNSGETADTKTDTSGAPKKETKTETPLQKLERKLEAAKSLNDILAALDEVIPLNFRFFVNSDPAKGGPTAQEVKNQILTLEELPPLSPEQELLIRKLPTQGYLRQRVNAEMFDRLTAFKTLESEKASLDEILRSLTILDKKGVKVKMKILSLSIPINVPEMLETINKIVKASADKKAAAAMIADIPAWDDIDLKVYYEVSAKWDPKERIDLLPADRKEDFQKYLAKRK